VDNEYEDDVCVDCYRELEPFIPTDWHTKTRVENEARRAHWIALAVKLNG
jgi:hypothetical protein